MGSSCVQYKWFMCWQMFGSKMQILYRTNSCVAKKFILICFESWGFLHHHPSFCSDLQAVRCFLVAKMEHAIRQHAPCGWNLSNLNTGILWTKLGRSLSPNLGVQGYFVDDVCIARNHCVFHPSIMMLALQIFSETTSSWAGSILEAKLADTSECQCAFSENI